MIQLENKIIANTLYPINYSISPLHTTSHTLHTLHTLHRLHTCVCVCMQQAQNYIFSALPSEPCSCDPALVGWTFHCEGHYDLEIGLLKQSYDHQFWWFLNMTISTSPPKKFRSSVCFKNCSALFSLLAWEMRGLE